MSDGVGEVAASTLAARRVGAVSSFLQERAPLLLPLASHLGHGQPLIESGIRGSSMWPAIPRGARLRIQLVGGDFCKPGDIVYYLADNGFVVHRVVYRAARGPARDYFITRGDSLLAPDPPVRTDQVLGVVTAIHVDGRWGLPGPLSARALHARTFRSASLAVTIAALWASAPAARWLAAFLMRLETLGRPWAQRLRQHLHRS